MEPELFSYLSIRNDSELESGYVETLKGQFEVTTDQGLHQLALFAYHLLFICYFNQILNKMRIWFPSEQSIAFVSFDKERRQKFRSAQNPTDYVHKNNRERSLFELLNLFCDCEDVVGKCKKLVDHRNERLGHVNYLVLAEEEFSQQIEKYNEAINAIHLLTIDRLKASQLEFVNRIDKRQNLTKDDVDLGLVFPYKLSQMDLSSLFAENQEITKPVYKKINQVLEEDFGIGIIVG